MAIPTWAVAQVLNAADLNSWFVPLVAYKTANESVTSSTTLQNDDDLFLALVATGVYIVDAYLIFDGATAGDFKYKFTVPAGCTFNYLSLHEPTPETDSHANAIASDNTVTGAIGANGAGVSLPEYITGLVTTTGTAGNLQLQWAQNTSSATATRVLVGSYIKAQRVG